MSIKMKNISQAEVLTLKEQISYQDGQVVSKTLAQNPAVSITLFSFAKGEEISTHASDGDAFVTCLDGVGKITIDGTEYLLHEGESIIMPAGHPHAVYGQEAFVVFMLLTSSNFSCIVASAELEVIFFPFVFKKKYSLLGYLCTI